MREIWWFLIIILEKKNKLNLFLNVKKKLPEKHDNRDVMGEKYMEKQQN